MHLLPVLTVGVEQNEQHRPVPASLPVVSTLDHLANPRADNC